MCIASLAATVILFGCGDDGEGKTSTPSPTRTSTPSTTSTESPTYTPSSVPTATATASSTATLTPTSTPTPTDTATPTPTATETPTATPRPTPIAIGAPACLARAGMLPEQTLPVDARRGAEIPIDHIVILMKENRSFDHYFGRLSAAGKADVDGLPPDAANPDAQGNPVFAHHEDRYCVPDTNHSWTGSHRAYDDGRNDGFVTLNDPGGERAMGYYEESDLPYYYALAKTFAIGDRYFCGLLGPTLPNRFYLLTGSSFGFTQNVANIGGYTQRTIFDLLDDHGIEWRYYYSDAPIAYLFTALLEHPRIVPISQYFADAAAGLLAPVTFIDPAFSGLVVPQSDEHPPSNVQVGQQFTAGVINALIASPNWPRSVFFLLYDEHGGLYDHVPPPPACPPDDIAPMLNPGDFEAQFDRYGFRVPFIAVSPYVKPGFVSHTVYDHGSVLRFIEARFGLPALTHRDANAEPMLDLFDFGSPALLTPPALPDAVVDPAHVARCRSRAAEAK